MQPGWDMERGFVGVLLICFVASTVGVLVLYSFSRTESVSMIRLDAFKEGVGKTRSCSLELLTRRPIKHLVVQLQYLVRVDEETHDSLLSLLDREGLSGPSEKVFEANPKISKILEMMQPFPSRPQQSFFRDSATYESHLWEKGREIRRTARYDVAVLDLHRFLEYLPESARPDAYTCYTVFAAFFHGENISFYEGVSDFYLDRKDSLGEVSYQAGEEGQLYENPRVAVPRGPDYIDVGLAPPFGTVSFEDLGRGQTIKVFFTTRHLASPAVLLTRVSVDGGEEKRFYVFLGWPEEPY